MNSQWSAAIQVLLAQPLYCCCCCCLRLCVQDLLAAGTTATDASGNAILADVGPWLRDEFKKFFKVC